MKKKKKEQPPKKTTVRAKAPRKPKIVFTLPKSGPLRIPFLFDVAREEALFALRRGDIEPFFLFLREYPALLIDPEIYRATVGSWTEQKLMPSESELAHKQLRRIGDTLARMPKKPHGRPAIPDEETRKQNKRESNKRAKQAYDERKRKVRK